jgi:hypothetical protein
MSRATGIATAVGSALFAVACSRTHVRPPRSVAARAEDAPTGRTVLASDAPDGVLLVAPTARLTSAPGALVVSAAAPTAPTPAPLAASTTSGPPADAVVAAMSSLTEEAQVVAPNAATLPFYDFKVSIDPLTGDLTGQERIDYPNRLGRPLDALPLRVFANGEDSLVAVEGAVEEKDDPSLVRLPLGAPLAPGAWAHLEVSFHGRIPPAPEGASLAGAEALLASPGRGENYGLFSRFEGGVALAQWLPMVAAIWKGDFDRGKPSGIGDSSFFDLSSFRGTVDLPAEYRVAVPGVVLREERVGARRHTSFALADARDVAVFAAKDFRVADATEGHIAVHSIYRSGRGEPGQAVMQTARGALAAFTRAFGPYPYRSLVAVEVPLRGGAGGAEFPGLIAIGGFLYGEPGQLPEGINFNPSFLASLREFTVAHEVAHQWWALQVASNPREQPDVDEPLAQFCAAFFVGQRRGGPAMADALDHLVAVNYQAMRLLGDADAPAAQATSEFSSTAQYAGIVYGKAPFFYERVAAASSQSALLRGLAAYFRAYRFSVAERGDVVKALASIGGVGADRLQELQHQWFEAATGDTDLAGLGDPLATGLLALEGEDLDLEALLKAGPPSTPEEPKEEQMKPLDDGQTQALFRELSKTFGGLVPSAN